MTCDGQHSVRGRCVQPARRNIAARFARRVPRLERGTMRARFAHCPVGVRGPEEQRAAIDRRAAEAPRISGAVETLTVLYR